MLKQTNARFRALYESLDKENLDALSDNYAEDIIFMDPFHRVEGLPALTKYFSQMYANVKNIAFEFGEVSYGDGFFHQDWIMTYAHPRINRGKEISVAGTSKVHINPEGKIIKHQDYFDSAAMLYKHLPLIGWMIKFIVRRFN